MFSRVNVTLALFTLCLLIGGTNHALDIARGGLLPYRTVPMLIDIFWTALCPLDLLAAWLLWKARNAGLLLALAILVSDVGVNSWLAYFSGLHVQSFEPLQVQTLVLGFFAGAVAFVWRRTSASARIAPR
jgi:tryptophan-rich sensory protein